MLLNGRGGQCFLFPLTHGWWQMPSGGGSSSGKKTTGSGGVNLFGLLSCVLNHKEGGCKGVPCRCRVPSSRADEEQQMKRQVGRAARIEAFFICPCFALLCSFVCMCVQSVMNCCLNAPRYLKMSGACVRPAMLLRCVSRGSLWFSHPLP